jgi:AIPR protein
VANLHVRQVAAAIHRDFAHHLDLSDVHPKDQENCLLSRGLSALAVRMLTGRDPAAAAVTVVDGYGDRGIDAICVEENPPRIILVQSKWNHSGGQANISLGDAHKFIEGLKALTDERFDRFNNKVKPFTAQLSAALREARVRIVLAVVSTGGSALSTEVKQAFDDVCAEMNEPGDIIEARVFGLAEVHRFLAEDVAGGKVDLDVVLENWGMLTEPYQAFYGTASASQIASWHAAHGDRLFDGNIRRALGTTPVNRSLIETLQKNPERFWYFNNGITVLCGEIRKTGVSAAHRTFGQFALSGVTVVNGAQTVASIAEAGQHDPDCLDQAQVWVRLISLTDCPDSFGEQVTRATNTQNTVQARDFVALDDLQSRLRQDFALTLAKLYVIKRGEQEPDGDDGCSVVDAADALACAYPDPSFAVTAKSSRGQLLESSDSYYKRIFRRDLTAQDVWNAVRVLRAVDAELEKAQHALSGRDRTVALQGNRLVAHLVFAELNRTDAVHAGEDWGEVLMTVPAIVDKVLRLLIKYVALDFADNYVTSLFKNVTKCRQLAASVQAELITEQDQAADSSPSSSTS